MDNPMKLESPAFLSTCYYGVRDPEAVGGAVRTIVESLVQPRGIFSADNLVTYSKSLSFLKDKPFIDAYSHHSTTPEERAALWRRVTLVWAARSALRLDGDFVECGCYKGTGPRIVAEALDFARQDRRYWLYDLFEHNASMPHHHMMEHSATLHDEVKARFTDFPNVIITKGRVPDSFEGAAPEKIALMHLDLNNTEAEVAALDALFDRIVPGGFLLLDDFGWLGYQKQLEAEKDWFGQRGYFVLELPTGQGLVIK
jgi:hypothetical protein